MCVCWCIYVGGVTRVWLCVGGLGGSCWEACCVLPMQGVEDGECVVEGGICNIHMLIPSMHLIVLDRHMRERGLRAQEDLPLRRALGAGDAGRAEAGVEAAGGPWGD